MKIHCKYDQLIEVDKLIPHAKNRNSHSKEQITRLAKLLEYQGVRAPIIVDKSFVIHKGHGTLMAIKENGWATAPIVFQEFESEEQSYAFVQSDNAISAWSELDLSAINLDIGDLGPDFDLEMLGLMNFTVDPTFEPGTEAEQGKLDEKKPVQCPNCGEMFEPKS